MLCLSQHVSKALSKMKMCLVLKAISSYLKMLLIFVHIWGVFFVVGKLFHISWQISVHFDNRTSDSVIDGRWWDRVLPDPALWLLLEHFNLLFSSVAAFRSLMQKDTPPKAMPELAAAAGAPCRMPTLAMSLLSATPYWSRELPTWTASSNNRFSINNDQSTREQAQYLKNKEQVRIWLIAK